MVLLTFEKMLGDSSLEEGLDVLFFELFDKLVEGGLGGKTKELALGPALVLAIEGLGYP